MEDLFTRDWIIKNAVRIIGTYSEGITIRQLHYRLVASGMTNDVQHYKRVVTAMKKARWDSTVRMDAFIDRERSMVGRTESEEKNLETEIEKGKEQIDAWMNAYNLEMWSNQDDYIEVWIEKKALQGVFERPCAARRIGLGPCKGYPSITFLSEARLRFREMEENGKRIIILYFGDYDPSGEDIPRSVKENIERMGTEIEVDRIALNPDQIKSMRLSGVPPKTSDSRTANWDGLRAVELDAVEPITLQKMCAAAIDVHFNKKKYGELEEREDDEREKYKKALKKFVKELD